MGNNLKIVENEIENKVFTKSDLMKQLSDYLAKGKAKGYEIGLGCTDNLIRFETGKVCVITGIPQSGKTELLNFFNMRLNQLHEWRSVYYSPENHPIGVYLLQKLLCNYKNEYIEFKDMIDSKYESDIDYLTTNFYFLNHDIIDDIDIVLKEAESLINKDKKIKVVNLDPFNSFEHQFSGHTETQYVGVFMNKLRKFASKNDVLVNLVAHPTKVKEGEKITGNSIYGSYNFFAKTDYAYVVHRHFDSEIVDFETLKIKQKNLGSIGKYPLQYDWKSGNYSDSFSESNELIDSLEPVKDSEKKK